MASDVVIAMPLVCEAGWRGARDTQGKKQLHPRPPSPPPHPLAQNAFVRLPRFLRLALKLGTPNKQATIPRALEIENSIKVMLHTRRLATTILAQYSVGILEQCLGHSKQCRNNVV